MKRLILTAFSFLVGADVFDLWTSWKTPAFLESNPFARNMDYTFNLPHAIEVKALTLLTLLIFATFAYVAIAGYSPDLAAFIFAGILFYYAADVWLNASTPNFMLYLDKYLHWYVPDRGPN